MLHTNNKIFFPNYSVLEPIHDPYLNIIIPAGFRLEAQNVSDNLYYHIERLFLRNRNKIEIYD